jgi:hypothetical protein
VPFLHENPYFLGKEEVRFAALGHEILVLVYLTFT